MEQALIQVGGMHCQGCVKNVTAVLMALAGVKSAEVSLEAAEAKVSFDPALTVRAALMDAIENAGFDAH